MITESIENDELQDMSEHILWGEARRRKVEETKTSKFIQKMGVAMDSDVGVRIRKNGNQIHF